MNKRGAVDVHLKMNVTPINGEQKITFEALEGAPPDSRIYNPILCRDESLTGDIVIHLYSDHEVYLDENHRDKLLNHIAMCAKMFINTSQNMLDIVNNGQPFDVEAS